jgi:hypothetical protein
LLVFAGITAGGVGVQVAIEGAAEPLPLPARIALCGGAAVTLLGMDLIDWAAPSSPPQAIGYIAILALS